ncbi:MAG: hypothetical protein ACI4HJ_02690 [Ruminococcus sp.]
MTDIDNNLEKIQEAEAMSLIYQRDSRRIAGFVDIEREDYR